MTIQHFLAQNPSKVLNGQHKWVIFHWSSISPSLVKLFFQVLQYHHPLLCRTNAAWDMHWRYRENEMVNSVMKRHAEFVYLSFRMFFMFCFWENVFFNSYVACYVICACRRAFKQPFSDVLQNRCSSKFRNIHRKAPLLTPLSNKVSGLKACIFI